MPRRPDRDDPQPPQGGRAAERLRDFLRRRSGGEPSGAPGATSDEDPPPGAGPDPHAQPGTGTADDQPAP